MLVYLLDSEISNTLFLNTNPENLPKLPKLVETLIYQGIYYLTLFA